MIQSNLVDAGLNPERPEAACVNWSDCGNVSAGGEKAANQMCDECLDAARYAGHGRS